MHQSNLFGQPQGNDAYGHPLARSSDPQTSHTAAQKHVESGNLKKHAGIVLRILYRQKEPLTYAEIFAQGFEDEKSELGDDKEVARRLPDLERGKLARRVHKDGEPVTRRCRLKGSMMGVWEAVRS